MSESMTLIKANPLLPAEDYVALRKQGIDSIQRLGSAIWTEYNNSDPGITILEAVSYAITDLAYRTGFAMKDLLTPQNLSDDTWKQIFYTARKILHNSPLTINDYRKLLIDVTGVRNAWVEPSKDYEVPVWIDYNYWEVPKEDDCGCGDAYDKVCHGRLGFDPISKDQRELQEKEQLKKLDDQRASLSKSAGEKTTALAKLIEQRGIAPDDAARSLIQAEVDRQEIKIGSLRERMGKLDAFKTAVTSSKHIESKIVEFEGLYNVMIEYEENVLEEGQRESVRQHVIERLYENRNLSEDFLSVNAVEYEEFGIKARIELYEYADPDTVLAEIFFAIYRYFTPSIPFHTITEMQERGYTIDEIFNGPPLKHGFIDTVELEDTDLFRDIRLSDLINEISDINGVKAITSFFLPEDASDRGRFFNEWVASLKTQRKVARIEPARSLIYFCKEREIITYFTGGAQDRRPERMLKLFRDRKTLERQYKLKGHEKDFEVPVGEYMELEEYFPITNSLPMCYGVGERAGLSDSADEKRKIQALQLKGYLLFFEQILVDYLAQLNHLRDLYTFDTTPSRTSFTHILGDLDGIQDLLVDHQGRGENHFAEILHDFSEVVENLLETPKQFRERRNIFLNHMLARFGENVDEYEAISRWLTPNNVDDRLIGDKIAMLKDGEYYDISTERGEGYNYSRQDFWETQNVSGTERRVSRLLGFRDIRRRNLAPEWFIVEPVWETTAKSKQPEQKKNAKGKLLSTIKLVDLQDKKNVLLESVEVQDGCCIEELMMEILEHAGERSHFVFHEEVKQRSRKTAGVVGVFWFELWDGSDPMTATLLAESQKYDKREQVNAAYDKLQDVIRKIDENEGFHLVEHLLLRPKFDVVFDEAGKPIDADFLNVCLDPCDLGIGLGEGEIPPYRKVVRRIPAALCYDKMPWVLEYKRYEQVDKAYNHSMLYQEVFTDATPPVYLKFRRYEYLAERVRDLAQYGSESINFQVVSNESDVPANVKYGFIIRGEANVVLAQSPYMFNKRTAEQKKKNEKIVNDIDEEIARLIEYFSFQMDLYCNENPCDHNEDPYSFRTTIVIPCWPKRLRDKTFRNLFEKTVEREAPAHIHTRIVWVGIEQMRQFEAVYYEWLQEMAQTEMPSFEHVDPLVKALNTLRPCGCCTDDCKSDGKRVLETSEAPRKHDHA